VKSEAMDICRDEHPQGRKTIEGKDKNCERRDEEDEDICFVKSTHGNCKPNENENRNERQKRLKTNDAEIHKQLPEDSTTGTSGKSKLTQRGPATAGVTVLLKSRIINVLFIIIIIIIIEIYGLD